MDHVTRILQSINEGDSGAADKLLPLVYGELRKLAARRLANEVPGQTLQPTARMVLLNQAVELNETLIEREPNSRVRTEQAPFAWQGRGQALAQTKRYDEATRDYDLAIQNANPGFREELRLGRAGFLIQMARYRKAMQELRETKSDIEQFLKAHRLADQYLRCAKLFVECGTRATQDASLDGGDRDTILDECCDEAIELLRKARENGLNDFGSLKSAVEFEPLHNRKDFELLFQQP